MKFKTSFRLLLPSLAVLTSCPLQAADPAGSSPVWVEYPSVSTAPAGEMGPAVGPAATPREPARPRWPQGAEGYGDVKIYAAVTPKVLGFDYFDGVGENLAQPVEKYGPLEGFNGSRRSGMFADVDADVVINNGERDLFTLERRGFGQHNHRGEVRFDDDEITLSGAYTHFRSLSGGIDYLYSPGVVAGANDPGIPAIYTPDATYISPATTQYEIDRTSYAAGFRMKPKLLGGVATLALNYEGYKREGTQLVGGEMTLTPDDAGTPGVDEYTGTWRGFNVGIDERMNRVALSLSATPEGLFDVAYDVSLEKFTNQERDLTRNDFLGTAGATRQALSPFHFVPDTSQLSQSLRLTKNLGERAVVSAGYSYATVEQDNFPIRFTTFGDPYTTGKITSQSGFVTANANISATLGAEGYVKYSSRDNDSSFPVDHVIGNAGANPRMTGPRINNVESLEYGVAANWRPGLFASTLTVGWQHLDRDRDLSYYTGSEGIAAERILYRDTTDSDEVYLKWIARPVPGMTLRIAPSFVWAGKTGLVTEPEHAARVKTMLSYASATGWLLSGFYDYQNQRNNDMGLTGATSAVNQNRQQTLHSAGVSFSMPVRRNINANANLYWTQNDLTSYFMSYTTPRSAAAAEVYLRDQSGYKVDSYVLSLGADWQVKQALKVNGSYTYTHSVGDTASGSAAAALLAATGTVDGRIDNTLHSVALGADYDLSDDTRLRAGYYYDYYDDEAYGLLTGGVSTLILGLSFGM